MSQLSLFQSDSPAPERRPVNLDYVRKHLNRVVRLAQAAERMPWSVVETQSWERQFPELAKLLPDEEGARLYELFEAEIRRLRIVTD